MQARALSLWLGLTALGGMVFGMYGAQHPFGGGLVTHPLFIFCGLAVAGLLILRFAGDRPLVSDRALIAGIVIGIACYFLGTWFGYGTAWCAERGAPRISGPSREFGSWRP